MKIRMQSLGLRVAVLLCGAGLAVTAAKAQDTPPPPPSGQQGPPPGGMRGGMDPAMRAARLQRALGLTDDVTAQVKAILVDGSTKMQALRSSGSGSREDMMALRQSENTKVKALLTPDQATKYEEIEAQQRGRRGNGGPPPDGGGPPPPPQ